jgi:hypothetical protein
MMLFKTRKMPKIKRHGNSRKVRKNNAHFHAKANQQRRKTIFIEIEVSFGHVGNSKDMLDAAIIFHRNICGSETEHVIFTLLMTYGGSELVLSLVKTYPGEQI